MYVKFKKITFTKKSVIELLLGLMFVLPYAETGGLRKALEYFNDRVYIHPMIFIMFTTSIIFHGLILRVKERKRQDKLHNYFIVFFIIAFTFGIVLSLFSNQTDVFLIQYIWYIVPFIYARKVYQLVGVYNLNYKNILKNGLFFFSLFCIFSLVYSMLNFGFVAGTSVRLTGGSGGGGSVIFGYTIVLFFCLLIILRKHLSAMEVFLYGLTLVTTSVLTQSRGAIWMIFLMLVPYILGNKKVITKILIIFITTVVLIFLDPFRFIYNYAPRALRFEDSSRTLTWFNALKIYINQPLLNIFFGTGIGQFFPYQSWMIAQRSYETFYNIFSYRGSSLLVQPHNTFIYLMIETGIIGLTFFLFGFIKAFKLLKKKLEKPSYAYYLIGIFIYLNWFDSVLLVLPGIAGVWWLLLFFVIGYGNQLSKNEKLQNFSKL